MSGDQSLFTQLVRASLGSVPCRHAQVGTPWRDSSAPRWRCPAEKVCAEIRGTKGQGTEPTSWGHWPHTEVQAGLVGTAQPSGSPRACAPGHRVRQWAAKEGGGEARERVPREGPSGALLHQLTTEARCSGGTHQVGAAGERWEVGVWSRAQGAGGAWWDRGSILERLVSSKITSTGNPGTGPHLETGSLQVKYVKKLGTAVQRP